MNKHDLDNKRRYHVNLHTRWNTVRQTAIPASLKDQANSISAKLYFLEAVLRDLEVAVVGTRFSTEVANTINDVLEGLFESVDNSIKEIELEQRASAVALELVKELGPDAQKVIDLVNQNLRCKKAVSQ